MAQIRMETILTDNRTEMGVNWTFFCIAFYAEHFFHYLSYLGLNSTKKETDILGLRWSWTSLDKI